MNGAADILAQTTNKTDRYANRSLQHPGSISASSGRVVVHYSDYDVVYTAYGQRRNDRHNCTCTVIGTDTL